jgi:hypothetical protein
MDGGETFRKWYRTLAIDRLSTKMIPHILNTLHKEKCLSDSTNFFKKYSYYILFIGMATFWVEIFYNIQQADNVGLNKKHETFFC